MGVSSLPSTKFTTTYSTRGMTRERIGEVSGGQPWLMSNNFLYIMTTIKFSTLTCSGSNGKNITSPPVTRELSIQRLPRLLVLHLVVSSNGSSRGDAAEFSISKAIPLLLLQKEKEIMAHDIQASVPIQALITSIQPGKKNHAEAE